MLIGRTALLVIDMQNDFIGQNSPCPCQGAEEIIPKIKTLIAACRLAAIPVIYTQETHRPSLVDMGRERPNHCFIGTPGVEICPELTPAPEDPVVTKPRYDAFMDTDISHVLHGYNVRANDTLIVCGMATNICVHYTASGAFQRDFHIRVVGDCCAGYNEKLHQGALDNIAVLEQDALTDLTTILPSIAAYAQQ